MILLCLHIISLYLCTY